MNHYPYNHTSVLLTEGDLCVIANSQGRLCGYCAFAPDEIPKEWHGNYSADALQYLQVHGGITYCEVHGDNDEERYAAAKAARDAMVAPPESESLDARMDFYNARGKASDAAKLAVPYERVVFGFDCAHLHDECNPDLSDPRHVLQLARQMREQIAAFASVAHQWREANRDTRMTMIDQIRDAANVKLQIGFGGLIGALAGASEFGEQQAEH